MSDKPFEALGEKLRSQRETKGLSLKAIADKTRIPPSVLQALESGDNSQLPAHVFVKGFLRSYSIEIGLNPEEIVGEYNYINPNQEKPRGSAGYGPEGSRRALLGVADYSSVHFVAGGGNTCLFLSA